MASTDVAKSFSRKWIKINFIQYYGKKLLLNDRGHTSKEFGKENAENFFKCWPRPNSAADAPRSWSPTAVCQESLASFHIGDECEQISASNEIDGDEWQGDSVMESKIEGGVWPLQGDTVMAPMVASGGGGCPGAAAMASKRMASKSPTFFVKEGVGYLWVPKEQSHQDLSNCLDDDVDGQTSEIVPNIQNYQQLMFSHTHNVLQTNKVSLKKIIRNVDLHEFSSLSISYESKRDDSNTEQTEREKGKEGLGKVVSNLLEVLRQFGVTWRPVPYKPREQRTESSEIFCKNLFLKDRRGQYFLIICDENREMNLKILRKKIGAYRNFTFGTPAEMSAILHVNPGGVTPFSFLYGSARDVRVVMTTDLTSNSGTFLNFHPLDETLTLPVKFEQLKMFFDHCRVALEVVDMKN